MKDERKTKAQLIEELVSLRAENEKLESLERGRKQIKDAFYESERDFRAITEDTTDVTIILDGDGIYRYVSPSIGQIIGFTTEDILGNPQADFIHPDDIDMMDEILTRAIKGQGKILQIGDFRFRHKEDRWVDLEGTATDMRGVPGINGIVINLRDITERKKAEEEIKYLKEFNEGIINSVVDPINIIDKDHNVIFQNRTSIKTFGEGIGNKCHSLYFQRRTPCEDCIVLRSIKEKGGFTKQAEVEDGFFLEFHSSPIVMPEGNLCAMELVRDISREKIFLDRLIEQNRKLEILNHIIHSGNRADNLLSLLEDVLKSSLKLHDFDGGGIYMVDESTRTAEIVCDMGLPDDFIGLIKKVNIDDPPFNTVFNDKEMVIYSFFEEFDEDVERRGEILSAASVPLISMDKVIGALNVASMKRAYLSEEEKEVLISIGREVGTSIARMQAEGALKESEEKWRNLFENSIEGAFTLDIKGNFTMVNRAFEEITGFTQDEIIGYNYSEYLMPEKAKELYIIYNRLYRTGEPVKDLVEIVTRKDGKDVILEEYVNVIRKGKRVIGFQGTIRDITRRVRAEESLAEEKERLMVTLKSIGDGVITTDTGGNIALMNKVAEELTGWRHEEAVGLPLGDVFYIVNEKTHMRCEDPVSKVMESGGIVGLANNTLLVSRDGTQRVIADSGSPIRDKDSKIIGVVLVFRDVTEKRKMEEELFRGQKLESLGILAGGIAHDYNNLLTGILANISLAKAYSEVGDMVYDRLEKTEKAAIMAGDLTRQLLTFSKGGAPVKETTSIRDLIKDSVDFALGGSNVTCKLEIADDLWPVEVDRGQINQVINNIVINADQAMPMGGTISVMAENLSITGGDGGDTAFTFGLLIPTGDYIRLSVIDLGIGISESLQGKIFDPFFTTKQKGSGLGLAVSYSIIKNHDGHITVESVEGKGTTLHIFLPVSRDNPAKKEEMEEKDMTGMGRILIMDDEEIVREVTAIMLDKLGYEVFTVEDGEEALTLYQEAKEDGRPIDVVIMDLTIRGGMGGVETMTKLQEIDPDVIAIVSSGYSNDPVMSDYKDYGFSGVLTKPYKTKELGGVLKKVFSLI